MCKITSKIKLCTCKATSTENLQNYWCLYRFNKDKNEMIVGEAVMSFKFDTLNHEVNKVVLEKRLNEEDSFDVKLVFKPKDILEIVCNNTIYNERDVYTFVYRGKKWKSTQIDSFELMERFDEVTFGKIKK
ncbi:hypothetical protein FIA58_005760 [Flavobacterium jejuense]|uniref:Uncharacterized protein n=1 Tax=Flavobacterium jejuense TaxID=1544455 RepID=A0ABX0IQ25_9FLAO|nr:hypothetical protein [Flavobacterium jejuense]NHN25180.1 hypothetical protein [Flavobacterium jejuense]